MKKTAMIATMVAAMFLVGPAAALDLETKDTQAESNNETYLVGSAGDVLYHDYSVGESVLACTSDLGWVCLEVENGETITIDDDSTLAAAAFSPQLGPFCGSIEVADFDGGHVDLFLVGPAFHAVDGCGVDGAPATSGTVTVS